MKQWKVQWHEWSKWAEERLRRPTITTVRNIMSRLWAANEELDMAKAEIELLKKKEELAHLCVCNIESNIRASKGGEPSSKYFTLGESAALTIIERYRKERRMAEDTRRFILWDLEKAPMQEEDGEFISEGMIGRITVDNVYLTIYADYPGDARPKDLEVGDRIRGVTLQISGESSKCDVWRVK